LGPPLLGFQIAARLVHPHLGYHEKAVLPVVTADVGAWEAGSEVVVADKKLLSRALRDYSHFEVRGLGVRYEIHGVSAGTGC